MQLLENFHVMKEIFMQLLQLTDINESPVYLLLNPTINHAQKDLPISIFESELHVIEGVPSLIFVNASYTIEVTITCSSFLPYGCFQVLDAENWL
jgi:hypothetical protein